MRRLEGHVRVSWRKGVLEALVPLRADARRLALSAVIEETSGALSYWALRHAAGKPDFHHADAFTHPLDEDRP
jgi:hypothetical protein